MDIQKLLEKQFSRIVFFGENQAVAMSTVAMATSTMTMEMTTLTSL
jgi:hypothetical protein